jgi:hypothetical protein
MGIVRDPAMAQQSLFVSLEPVGGIYSMFATDTDRVNLSLRLRVINPIAGHEPLHVVFHVTDANGRPVEGLFKGGKISVVSIGEMQVELEQRDIPLGYYSIWADIDQGQQHARAWTDLAVVAAPHLGMRKQSFFASNTSWLKIGKDGELLRLLGIKVQRAHFHPDVSKWPDAASDRPLPLDFSRLDHVFAQAQAQDSWILPIVGYTLSGQGREAKSAMAMKMHMHGPPRHMMEFVNTWEQILRHYPQIDTWEFWNEPWIYGWTWAADAATYRAYQENWCKMALRVNPNLKILAGNSVMFMADNIEPYPTCWKGLIHGLSNHPYGFSTDKATFRYGDQFRNMDYGAQVAREMGLPYYYLTEGGTMYKAPLDSAYASFSDQISKLDASIKQSSEGKQSAETIKELSDRKSCLESSIPSPFDNLENACKIVEYTIRQALSGGYQSNMQWNIGYGPDWTLPNAAVATMTHALEDRPCLTDIWPEQELITGAIFANVRFATEAVKALPRADELQQRWKVPVPKERCDDATKVAVVYALTGPSVKTIDSNGLLVLDNADLALSAMDMTGRSIEQNGTTLVVPLSAAPSYILSDKLDVIQLRQRVRQALIQHVTPVNIYPFSLLRPADQKQDWFIRVQNQINVPVQGQLNVVIGGNIHIPPVDYTVGAGQVQDIAIPWPGISIQANNQYQVSLQGTAMPVDMQHAPFWSKPAAIGFNRLIQVARFVQRTIQVNGQLDDWKDVQPVVLDNRMLERDFNPTRYLLNPHLKSDHSEGGEHRIIARVYTAYDAANIYVAFAINQDKFLSAAGKPAQRRSVELPYKNGLPDGLGHAVTVGDMVQIALGIRDRVPGYGRKMNDPWRWKGWFCDTDYQFNACQSVNGNLLIEQWGAHTLRNNAYQTEAVPGVGPVKNGKLVVRRDEVNHLTIYEMSIPRSKVSLFDPSAGKCRFSFMVYNSQGQQPMNWAEACGVFDYWLNSGSFAPTWTSHRPCQTWFGIEQ